MSATVIRRELKLLDVKIDFRIRVFCCVLVYLKSYKIKGISFVRNCVLAKISFEF